MDFLTPPPPGQLHALTTHWTEIEGFSAATGEDLELRWRRLLRRYEGAIRGYVALRCRRASGRAADRDEVEDITQDFFLGAVRGGWLEVDRKSTRSFRAYLQAILHRRVVDALRRRVAAKRRPGSGEPIPLNDMGDITGPTPAALAEPDEELLHQWAHGVALRAVELMKKTAPARGSAAAEVLVALGVPAQHLVDPSKPATPPTKSRAKRDLTSFVAAALLETLDDPAKLEAEWLLFRKYIA